MVICPILVIQIHDGGVAMMQLIMNEGEGV